MCKQIYRHAALKKAERETQRKATIVINAARSVTLDEFPLIEQYLQTKFPHVDISHVPIYLAGKDIFRKVGWRYIGGCYIPHLNIILLKDNNEGDADREPRGRFDREMHRHSLKLSVDDILVHEAIHAISTTANRSSSRHRHMEEEFVYTNCIDFYKAKGWSDEDIIEQMFLPFCIQDVMSNRKDMDVILVKLSQSRLVDEMNPHDYWDMTGVERRRFLNENATFLVKEIVQKSREHGSSMIVYYNEHGRGVEIRTGEATDKSLRFASLGMDCDI